MAGWAPQVSCSMIRLWRSLKVSEPESPLGKMREWGHKISGEYFWLRYQNSSSSWHSLEGVTPLPVPITPTTSPLPKRWSFLSWTSSAPPWDLGERLGKGHFKATIMPSFSSGYTALFSPQLLYIPHFLTTPPPQRRTLQAIIFFQRTNLSVLPCLALNFFSSLRIRLQIAIQAAGYKNIN